MKESGEAEYPEWWKKAWVWLCSKYGVQPASLSAMSAASYWEEIAPFDKDVVRAALRMALSKSLDFFPTAPRLAQFCRDVMEEQAKASRRDEPRSAPMLTEGHWAGQHNSIAVLSFLMDHAPSGSVYADAKSYDELVSIARKYGWQG